ncbi:MAG TPA: hypothetical protein VHX38_31725 [Pseudonocardiaceae bacterium]|nr:hypothetical protein [Pseudonocardiaceae bacterium]
MNELTKSKRAESYLKSIRDHVLVFLISDIIGWLLLLAFKFILSLDWMKLLHSSWGISAVVTSLFLFSGALAAWVTGASVKFGGQRLPLEVALLVSSILSAGAFDGMVFGWAKLINLPLLPAENVVRVVVLVTACVVVVVFFGQAAGIAGLARAGQMEPSLSRREKIAVGSLACSAVMGVIFFLFLGLPMLGNNLNHIPLLSGLESGDPAQFIDRGFTFLFNDPNCDNLAGVDSAIRENRWCSSYSKIFFP